MASTIFWNKQFVMVLPIGGFRLDLFPEEISQHTNDFVEAVRLTRDHLIYHEMQHIKNKYDYPRLFQIESSVQTLADNNNYFKVSACNSLDEYFATLASQQMFRTETDDNILIGFEELHNKMNKKILEKSLTRSDVVQIAKFYTRVFAVNNIKETRNGVVFKIEDALEGIEKRFFINLDNAFRDHSNVEIDILVYKITTIFSDFYRFGSRPPKIQPLRY
jgi:hypothetical protein